VDAVDGPLLAARGVFRLLGPALRGGLVGRQRPGRRGRRHRAALQEKLHLRLAVADVVDGFLEQLLFGRGERAGVFL
jgi:hypothetical protein